MNRVQLYGQSINSFYRLCTSVRANGSHHLPHVNSSFQREFLQGSSYGKLSAIRGAETTAIRGKKGNKQCGSRTGPNAKPCFGFFSLSPLPQKHHFIEATLPSLACTTLVPQAGLGGNITQVHFLLSPPP